ncbi:MAG TPA: BlaI/MecI/CopY family transcriptional regulator [Longimicrobiales bacterium]|nr:BlaI/MecI/CopY family transcriptional regulator [Longimicrobiales bacterium]
MGVRFTERELDIMQVLWDEGPATVAEVRDALEDELAHNTVLTMLKVLEEKGHVRRDTEQRAHRFEALVERGPAGASALRRVTKQLFQGSPEELVLNLVESQDLDDEEIARLRDLLDARLQRGSPRVGPGARDPEADR